MPCSGGSEAGGGKRQSLPRFVGATGPSEIVMSGSIVVIRQGPTNSLSLRTRRQNMRRQGGADSGRVRSLTNRSINDRRSKRAMSGLKLGEEIKRLRWGCGQ